MTLSLNLVEFIFVFLLLALCLGTLLRNWWTTPVSFWSPLSLIALLFLYYTVLGPLYFIASGQTIFLGIDFRSSYWLGWAASLVSFVAIIVGYLSYRGSKEYIGPVCSDILLQKFALGLIGLSFLAMLYWTTYYRVTASMFNPFYSTESRGEITQYTVNPFANYLVNFINLSIPAIVLSMLVWLERKSLYALITLVFVLFFGLSFFLSSGFRFRIVWMAIAMVAAYHIWLRRRPNLLLLGTGGTAFLALMGLIGMVRNYWSGLSFEKAEGATLSDYIDRGFSEAGIFTTICSVVEAIPERIGHTHFDPIWITLTFPIPRRLWEGKPESETLQAMSQSFGSRDAFDAGQAMPFFAEWYVAFGWPGLIISSFLLGWLCKRLWVWFLQRRDDKLVVLTYTTTLGFLYFVFSRGYTPLMTLNFVFGIFPFFLFYGWLRRRAFLRAMKSMLQFQAEGIDPAMGGRMAGGEGSDEPPGNER